MKNRTSLPFELVIFDCDGVLVDSERITNRIFAQMLGELGLSFTLDQMFEEFVGRSMEQCVERITELLGQAPPEDFLVSYRARTAVALQNHLTPVEGIEEALDRIALPYCVASSGDHDKMRLTLGLTGLYSRFAGKVFSVVDVKNPKPAPDVFLHAASKMGATPNACVVVEDSPTGVAAAVAAGMTVFGYCALTPSHKLQAAGAHHLLNDMRQLPRLLSSHEVRGESFD
jgi:HAD superfamily hydrolase (TIGR01509 family)